MKVWAVSPVMEFERTAEWDELEDESQKFFFETTNDADVILVPPWSADEDAVDLYEFAGTREELNAWVERVNRFFPWDVLGVDDALD